MGCAASTERHGEWRDTTFQCLRELQGVLRWSGLRSTNLIIGVDFTRSNMWNGKQSFGGRCLHFIDPEGLVLNPYQVVINIIGRTLLSRKSKRPIHAFGFGDARTADRCVFTFLPDGSPCRGVDHVLAQYKEIAPELVLGGPTNFAPMIYQAIRQVKATGTCSILVIIADGQVTSEKETSQVIAEASNYALAIIVVGVGDGPWEDMEHYTDTLPKRRFENFRFVNLNEVMSANPEQSALGFATAALAHIPDQLAGIRRLGLLQPTDCDAVSENQNP
ncbi:hypothetical protein PF005_g117 [Phytophthora fragariae]|uniref:VWFA domain-containing protein n=1 Tax=Phytophthora fragariae TaxID=53985 RepID=A0A6A3U3Q5_9STRA|nr:hypothetical protein PF003_g32479 [Phytophthora fragariae]KAE8950407.1 hypothetical protein PF009_g117 [Phytophthora fragariae]KAE9031469.1 hypothetical protein PF011_g108 [Phytophthora fragariae]KAE9140862.1 hypothetical protein PF010_g18 [Phytophthora fragariae]KAE9141711.1 hypothetical protein PF007_g53 [Phytophthora fragariae]